MSDEKSARERTVFHEFIQLSGLPIFPESVESRKEREPDILCKHKDEGNIAFELVELCAPEIAKAITNDLRTGECTFVRTESPSHRIVKNKLEKRYVSKSPIELLIYNGRAVDPDDFAIAEIQRLDLSKGQFRRIWFMGKTCQILWSKD